jgi:hypothetical protein
MQNIWIFQLAAPLTAEQKNTLEQGLGVYVRDAWKAHGAPVPGEMEIRHDQFLIIQAEPGSTSGCSIDSMTKAANTALQSIGAQRVESQFIAFRDAQGKIAYLDFRQIGQALAEGRLTAETTIFNAALQPGEPLSQFEIPLKASWMKRYLVATS